MTAGSSFVQMFGGTAIRPAQPSYEALTIAANQALVWPLESAGGNPYVAAIMGVTASANSLQLQMPPGNTGSNGVQTIVMNLGANSFTVTDTAGNAICAVATTQAWVVTLTDNTTTNGSWLAIQLGSTVSQAVAAALAGYGLEAVGTQLWANWPTTTVSVTGTIDATMRSNAIVWNGSTGTLQLAGIGANLGIGWFAAVSNQGTGALTLETSGADTINGEGSIVLQPGNSGLIVAGSGAFTTFGLLPSVLPITLGGTGAASAPAALTSLGGTALGTSIFTAASSAAVLALLGLNSSIFTENTVTTSQVLAAGSSGTVFVTSTAGLTFTLPLTTTLTKSFVVGFFASGQSLTLVPQASDTIFGQSTGANFYVPSNCTVMLVTDANGKWFPVFSSPVMTSGGNIAFPAGGSFANVLTCNQGLTVTNGGALAVQGVANFTGGANSGTSNGYALFNTGPTPVTGLAYSLDAYFSHGIVATAFLAISDRRRKRKIKRLTPEDGDRYVREADPSSYEIDGVRDFGLIAQHEAHIGMPVIVEDQQPEAKPLKEARDRNGVLSPAGKQMSINYLTRIPFLIASGKMDKKRISDQAKRIENLEAQVAKLLKARK